MNGLFNALGVRIFSSELAMDRKPVLAHKKRRNQSKAYHARIQKKWNKRFGTKQVPGCWQTAQGLFMHPSLYKALQESFK